MSILESSQQLQLILEALILVVATLALLQVYSNGRLTRKIGKKNLKETRNTFHQLQALFALERKLKLDRGLPPTRGWAGSPDFLLQVCNEISTRRPNIVLECSSGVSTLVAARSLALNGSGHVYSLEHDPKYASRTRTMLSNYDLTQWATVVDAPLSREGGDTPWYSLSALPDIPPVDLLVVDGPPRSSAKLARLPALPRLASKLSDRAVIVLDDAARGDEQTTLARWKEEFPGFEQNLIPLEKGCAILVRSE